MSKNQNLCNFDRPVIILRCFLSTAGKNCSKTFFALYVTHICTTSPPLSYAVHITQMTLKYSFILLSRKRFQHQTFFLGKSNDKFLYKKYVSEKTLIFSLLIFISLIPIQKWCRNDSFLDQRFLEPNNDSYR